MPNTPPPQHIGEGALLGLTALAGTTFLMIDLAWRGSAVTPLLSLCWLLAISMRRGPELVVRMMGFLLIFVLASLWHQGWDRVIVRGTSFLVGGSIAYLHATARQRATRLIQQLRLIVERAPAALITADGMGCILSASEEIKELVGEEFMPLEGHSFSDVLMGQVPPGEAMRQYIEWFRREGMFDQEFSLRGSAETRFRGRVVCSGEGRDRLLIATLARPTENGVKGGRA